MSKAKQMTKEELLERIRKWEQRAGESFVDYFVDDRVNLKSWLFWLVGKGYGEFANPLINEIALAEATKQNTYIAQEDKYFVFPEYIENADGTTHTYSDENWEKSMELIADFLTATDLYRDRIEQWLFEEEKE